MKKAKPIAITFWDHAQITGKEPGALKCEVIGWLVKEDKLCYHLCTWMCDGSPDENAEWYSILKSAVVKKINL